MAFSVGRITEEDMPLAVAVLSDTFGHYIPAIDALYPHHDTPRGRNDLAYRLNARNKNNPNTYHMKIVDTDTCRIVGQSSLIYKPKGVKFSTPPDLDGPYWDSEDDLEYAKDLTRAYFKRRWQVFQETDGPVFAISAMTVLPEYQSKGAGSFFLTWAVAQADSCEGEMVVESAIGAERFYARHGFVPQELVNCATDMADKWKGRPEQLYTWMRRRPRANYNDL